jgi:phosphoglycerate dehydrogenase-like enzyme
LETRNPESREAMPAKPVQLVVFLNHQSVACWKFSEGNLARLCEQLPEAEVVVCHDEAAFLEALPKAEIALLWQFRQEWLEKATRLRWIATPAAGRDYFQVSLSEKIRLSYGSFHGELMAETVLGMMLGMSRGIVEAVRLQGTSLWPRADMSRCMRSLRGSHLAILGFGNIGQWVGRLAKPFGMRITGVKRDLQAVPDYFDEADRLVRVEDLETLLPTVDHLVLALPRSSQTDLLLNQRLLGLLPRQAVVYNVGRGNCIDEAALDQALRSGAIRGACLDVFQTEPLPADSPLRSAPNLLIMPHASAISPNYLDLFVDEFVREYRGH